MTDIHISNLIDRIIEIKNQEDQLNSELSSLKATREELELKLMQHMQEVGIERTGTTTGNVLIQHKRFPRVVDWDAFYTHIYDNNAAYLLQRRISTTAVEEYLTSAELTEIPGVNFFEEDQISVRRR